MTPKEWARANGYEVKEGRGRLPKHIAEAYKAAMAGQKVDAPKGVATKPTPATREFLEPAPKRWPDTTIAYAFIDGKRVSCSLRQACFHCGVSLQWCGCGSPKAIVTNTSGYVPVRLEIR